MMESWKEAFWLTRFELQYSKRSFLFLFAILILLLIFIVPTMEDYFDNGFISIDVYFVLSFTVVTGWVRPKPFKNDTNSNGLSASPYLMMLNEFPVKREIMIKHRILTYLLFSLSYNIVFLALLYVLTPIVQEKMSIGTYLVFSIFWLCFTIYFGSEAPASEAGFYKVPVIVRNLLIGICVTFILIIVYHKIYPHGFVHWTMFIASKYPTMVTLFSILFAIIGLKFWIRNMRRKMESLDYY